MAASGIVAADAAAAARGHPVAAVPFAAAARITVPMLVEAVAHSCLSASMGSSWAALRAGK